MLYEMKNSLLGRRMFVEFQHLYGYVGENVN
jgi:hypothetical protein